ncbi:multiple ankyrin repeats single kh domain protein [Rutstroemia sp. NJR-2017a BVV2]|nr:multiple ankyrin repeats single kh domain protein [Rutstroemia sp. NJR-2017a BVV2]
MDDWETHKDLLRGLYLTEKKSLGHIIKYMNDKFMFSHSKSQYETRFKKWGFRKNMNDGDWKRVYNKFHQRKLNRCPESAVLFNGVLIPHEKVKKEIARHVPLTYQSTYQFTSAQIPMDAPSPDGDVMVCTPPGTHQPPVLGSPTFIQQPDLLDLQETTLSRQYQSFAALSQTQYSNSADGTSSLAFHSDVVVDDIPFFQFQNIFRSEDVRSGFQKILTVKDDLCDDLVYNFWPDDSFTGDCPSNLVGMVPSTLSSLVGDEINYIMPVSLPRNHSAMSLYKPFGVDLIQWMDRTFQVEEWSGFDVLQCHSLAEVAIPKLLKMMPLRTEDDVQSNTALLLGPPIIRAARLFVEIGVYLVTNNIDFSLSWKIITWMLTTVPWSVLRPILSLNLLTIRAVSEVVFRVAIRYEYIQIVTDLFQLPLLQAAVISSSWNLCQAVENSNFGLVELLLEAGSDPNKGKYGMPGSLPLSLVQNIGIARLLVQAGAKVNETWCARNRNFSFHPPLVAAVEKGNFELVQYLIQMGANVDGPWKIYDEDKPRSVTALTIAISSGRLDIAELLLKHGAHTNPDVWAYELLPYDGKASFICPSECLMDPPCFLREDGVRILLSLLQIAAALRSHKLVELLVLFGSHPNDSQCNFKEIKRKMPWQRVETALQIAVSNGDVKLAEFLLHNGADINAFGYLKSGYPVTALFLAIDRRDPPLVDLLLRHGADLDFSYYGWTVLQGARFQNNSSIVDMLLVKNAPEVLTISDEQRDYELQEAVSRGDKEYLKRLMRLGLGPIVSMKTLKIIDGECLSILHLALRCQSFDPELFQLIVDETPDIAAHRIEPGMAPLLHQAVSVDKLEAVEILIHAGVDMNEVYRGETPLIRCVASNQDLAMISLLLSSGADLNVVVGNRNFTTALQASLRHSLKCDNRNEIFYFLMSKQASINAPVAPEYGYSELAYATFQGGIEIIQFLLNWGADVNTPAGNIGGYTALQAAAYLSNIDVIRLLLDNGADVNAPTAKIGGGTALQAAAFSSKANLDVIRLLLDRGADVNAPCSRLGGRTALQGAACMGHFQIVVLLLQLGADINIRITSSLKKTALGEAASMGRLDIVQLLLQNGADMNLPENERYIEAIGLAQEGGKLVVVELLEGWPTSEAGRKTTAKFGHLYKGAERVEEVSDGNIVI